jgi:hypothetical protein
MMNIWVDHQNYRSALMDYYIIAGIIFLICIIAIIFGLRVLKDTRNMQPKKMDEEEDDQDDTTFPGRRS